MIGHHHGGSRVGECLCVFNSSDNEVNKGCDSRRIRILSSEFRPNGRSIKRKGTSKSDVRSCSKQSPLLAWKTIDVFGNNVL